MASNVVAHKIDAKPRTDDVLTNENVDFSTLLVSDPVLKGLELCGFEKPSPIQLKAIPLGRCGLDLIVQAKSGTGKTCVYSVVALDGLVIDGSSLQVLVLAPTREIAVQIWEVIKALGTEMEKLCCYPFIGGLPIEEDKKKIKKCHIAVGTPGRVKQLIEEGIMNTESIRLFILDEADKLLEEGFQEVINWIYSTLPQNKQILALSATYPESLAHHLTAYMRNPTFIRLNSDDPALLGIRQYCKKVTFHPLAQKAFDYKVKELVHILSNVSFNQCLVFSNFQMRAQSLSDILEASGWPSTYISGSQDQQHRLTAMAQLKKYKCRVLISTDLTSRGIDAENVNLVINLDIPKDYETYLHRIGRAGRYGSFGAGISLASEGDEYERLYKIQDKCKTIIKDLPDPIPSDLAHSSGYVNIESLVTTEQILTNNSVKVNRSKESQIESNITSLSVKEENIKYNAELENDEDKEEVSFSNGTNQRKELPCSKDKVKQHPIIIEDSKCIQNGIKESSVERKNETDVNHKATAKDLRTNDIASIVVGCKTMNETSSNDYLASVDSSDVHDDEHIKCGKRKILKSSRSKTGGRKKHTWNEWLSTREDSIQGESDRRESGRDTVSYTDVDMFSSGGSGNSGGKKTKGKKSSAGENSKQIPVQGTDENNSSPGEDLSSNLVNPDSISSPRELVGYDDCDIFSSESSNKKNKDKRNKKRTENYSSNNSVNKSNIVIPASDTNTNKKMLNSSNDKNQSLTLDESTNLNMVTSKPKQMWSQKYKGEKDPSIMSYDELLSSYVVYRNKVIEEKEDIDKQNANTNDESLSLKSSDDGSQNEILKASITGVKLNVLHYEELDEQIEDLKVNLKKLLIQERSERYQSPPSFHVYPTIEKIEADYNDFRKLSKIQQKEFVKSKRFEIDQKDTLGSELLENKKGNHAQLVENVEKMLQLINIKQERVLNPDKSKQLLTSPKVADCGIDNITTSVSNNKSNVSKIPNSKPSKPLFMTQMKASTITVATSIVDGKTSIGLKQTELQPQLITNTKIPCNTNANNKLPIESSNNLDQSHKVKNIALSGGNLHNGENKVLGAEDQKDVLPCKDQGIRCQDDQSLGTEYIKMMAAPDSSDDTTGYSASIKTSEQQKGLEREDGELSDEDDDEQLEEGELDLCNNLNENSAEDHSHRTLSYQDHYMPKVDQDKLLGETMIGQWVPVESREVDIGQGDHTRKSIYEMSLDKTSKSKHWQTKESVHRGKSGAIDMQTGTKEMPEQINQGMYRGKTFGEWIPVDSGNEQYEYGEELLDYSYYNDQGFDVPIHDEYEDDYRDYYEDQDYNHDRNKGKKLHDRMEYSNEHYYGNSRMQSKGGKVDVVGDRNFYQDSQWKDNHEYKNRYYQTRSSKVFPGESISGYKNKHHISSKRHQCDDEQIRYYKSGYDEERECYKSSNSYHNKDLTRERTGTSGHQYDNKDYEKYYKSYQSHGYRDNGNDLDYDKDFEYHKETGSEQSDNDEHYYPSARQNNDESDYAYYYKNNADLISSGTEFRSELLDVSMQYMHAQQSMWASYMNHLYWLSVGNMSTNTLGHHHWDKMYLWHKQWAKYYKQTSDKVREQEDFDQKYRSQNQYIERMTSCMNK